MEKYSNFLKPLTELGVELKLILGSSECFLELFLFTLKFSIGEICQVQLNLYQKRTAKNIVKIN